MKIKCKKRAEAETKKKVTMTSCCKRWSMKSAKKMAKSNNRNNITQLDLRRKAFNRTNKNERIKTKWNAEANLNYCTFRWRFKIFFYGIFGKSIVRLKENLSELKLANIKSTIIVSFWSFLIDESFSVSCESFASYQFVECKNH